MKFALPIRETLNRGIHMFIWSWVLPNREFHMKLGTFKQDIFIWNGVLSNREVPMFICNRALPSRYFIWNLSCPIGEIQMCIWNCVLPIREIHMKLGISKTRISYEILCFQNENFIWNLALSKLFFKCWGEIWQLQAVTVFICSYEITYAETPNVKSQQF